VRGDWGGTIDEITALLKNYFSRAHEPFDPGKTKIPLSVPSYGWEEVAEAMESLLSTWVTMGEKVFQFESMWAEYIGVKHAIMVNSGSSANLIALSVLSNPVLEDRIKPGDEVIVPAVTWSTSIFPIVNVGAVPVLVDVDLETYTINVEQITAAITERTKAIMPVHLLGFSCDMSRIMEIAQAYDLFVIEDCCEAPGATYKGKKVGGFGDLGTFSFFFSHHISTIEGGMIVTNNDEYAELAKVLRAHGWIRELNRRREIASQYPDIDERFLFVNLGFNVRPTEIQGAFGIHQLKKLEQFIEHRRENANYWINRLSRYSDVLMIPQQEEEAGSRHVWFGFPITVKPEAPFTREALVRFLESRQIETRPIMAGNLSEQPALQLIAHRVVGTLPNSRLVMRRSFFFGNHHGIAERERTYIANCFDEFLMKKDR
jgi:CDP-6-deoxy-D-xylo-4-hexulose-3-dehydrase